MYEDRFRLSPRFKDALVADLVEVHGEDLKELVGEITTDESTWTENLARQLGFTSPYGVLGLHDTLMQVIYELDPLLNNWPLPDDGQACNEIAQSATRWLSPVEAYAMLRAGPKNWRKDNTLPRSFPELDVYLTHAVRRGLSSALKGLFVRWNHWDIRRLHTRWKEAESRRRADHAAQRRPTLTPEQLEQQKRDRADRRKQTKFIPPPPGTYEYKKTG
jgi:hypothetical protein